MIIKKSKFEALQNENARLYGKVADLEELVNVQRARIKKLDSLLADVQMKQQDKYTLLLEKYIAMYEREGTVHNGEK